MSKTFTHERDPDADQEPAREASFFDVERRRGRGAATNETGRFEREQREAVHDGWDIHEEACPFQTEVAAENARTIITRNTSPDVPFDRSINPYRGCEHGCVYCFARPTHAYLGLSPGLDFETKLFVKPNAAELLRRELAKPSYRPAAIGIGTNTDPYQPIEKTHEVMRDVLSVLLETKHPVTIVTKSALIVRDVDILADLAHRQLIGVALSVTSLDHRFARRMEPRASTPKRRLKAVETLRDAGVPVGVMAAPLIPALNDHEIENILAAARDAGAQWAEFVALRMPLEIKDLFRDWLREHFPDRAARVLRYIREMHGGRDYDPQWGRRLRGEGVYARLMAERFRKARRRYGLDAPRPELRTDLFVKPAKTTAQFELDLS
ncbi:MAG: PA0069 family radical SAM protein [Pseudomonadota bacterium]